MEAAEEAASAAYKYIRPLGLAADGYIQQVNDGERLYLGMPAVDKKIGGYRRGELNLVTGRPHSGKTQVVLNAINNNSNKRVLLFTPDETAEAVLAKLVAIRNGISADAMEAGVKAKDEAITDIVRRTAAHDFQHLLVISESLNFVEMGEALQEAEDLWGQKCHLVMYDYAELMQDGKHDGFEGVSTVMRNFKKWAKLADVPVVVLHQGKRSEGTRGQSSGMEGMRYGGESEAITVIEVYRKRDDPHLSQYAKIGEQDSVTLNVCKNKHLSMRLGSVDMYLNPDTGHIREMTAEDKIRAGAPTRDSKAALRVMKEAA